MAEHQHNKVIDIDHSDPLMINQDLNESDREDLRLFSEALHKLVNIGTHLLAYEASTPSKDPDLSSIVFVLFRRMIEMLDASSILMKEGSITACISNLRIFLEALFQFEYLLNDEELIPLKTKHFALMDLDSSLEFYESIFNDPEIRKNSPQTVVDIKHFRDNINIHYFKNVRNEYKAKVFNNDGTRKKASIKWYSFTSKANNVKYLSQILKKYDYYIMVYSYGSGVTHTSGITYDGLRKVGNNTYVIKMRNTEEAVGVFRAFVKLTKEALYIMATRLDEEHIGYFNAAMSEFDTRYYKSYK